MNAHNGVDERAACLAGRLRLVPANLLLVARSEDEFAGMAVAIISKAGYDPEALASYIARGRDERVARTPIGDQMDIK